jgi:hypothetical protein
MSQFERACAAADLWASAAKLFGGTGSEKQSFRQESSRLEILAAGPPAPPHSAKELVDQVNSLESQYSHTSVDSLFKAWGQQCRLYQKGRKLLKDRGSKVAGGDSWPVGTPEPTELTRAAADAQELRSGCEHYRKVLNERAKLLQGPASQLIQLCRRQDINREIDSEVSRLLGDVIRLLAQVAEPPNRGSPGSRSAAGGTAGNSRAASGAGALGADSWEWLFAALPDFCSSVCWPIPVLFQWHKQHQKKSLGSIDQSDASSGSDRSFPGILNCFAHAYSSACQANDDEFFDLWKNLFKSYLSLPDVNAGDELAEIVSKIFSEKWKWRDGSEYWPDQYLYETARLREPDTKLVPAILKKRTLNWGGPLDWTATKLSRIIKFEQGEPGLRFGIQGGRPPRLFVRDLKDWSSWELAWELADSDLKRDWQPEYAEQIDRCAAGQSVGSLAGFLQSWENTPERRDWLDKFIRSALKNKDQHQKLLTFLNIVPVQVYPRLDDNALPQWDEQLKFSPGAKEVFPDRLQDSPDKIEIQNVTRYAHTPEYCRCEYIRPIYGPFRELAQEIGQRGNPFSEELIKSLEEVYKRGRQVPDRQTSGFSEVLAHAESVDTNDAVKSLADVFRKPFQILQDQIPQNSQKNQLLTSGRERLRGLLQNLGGRLDPAQEILPSSFRLDDSWCCTPDPSIQLKYEYDDQVPEGSGLRVEKFGVRSRGQILFPAIAVISAGGPSTGYADILKLHSELSNLLGNELAEMLRNLPQREGEKPSSGDREELYTELFELIWPWPCNSKAEVKDLESDSSICQLREWYCKMVEEREVLRVSSLKEGQHVQNDEWTLGKDYDEANQGHSYKNGNLVETVVRPLLTLYSDDQPAIVKLRAVAYVCD